MRVSLFGCNRAVLLRSLNLFNRFFYRLVNSLTFSQAYLKPCLNFIFLSGNLFQTRTTSRSTLSRALISNRSALGHDNVGHGCCFASLRLSSCCCCFCLRAHLLKGLSSCALNDLLDLLDNCFAFLKRSVLLFECRFQLDHRLFQHVSINVA